jgi:hypothetical protein
MIYSVVPRELEGQLLDKLTAHYADEPEVTVIVDRRQGSRRARHPVATDPGKASQRQLRDRRRRRAGGDFVPLLGEGEGTQTSPR